jgi:parallel beta-helix repeat protein
MVMKVILVFLALFITSSVIYGQVSKQFNVKDYGAKGDGITDDTKSIQACLNAAMRQGGTVVLPSGNYKTSRNLNLYYHSDVDIIIKGNEANIYPTDKYYYIFCDNSTVSKKPIGSVTITGLTINASKLPHPQAYYYDNASCAYGVFLTNLRSINIEDCQFSNIYGSAIKLVYMDDMADMNSNTSVTIKNNKILNCWGMNPTKDYYDKNNPQKMAYDNYGDGIAIWGYSNAIIDHNYIFNNLAQTKYYGRAGIVVEHNASNCTISNNTINGYDRGIHLEYDKGGHTIINNRLSGSDVGIYCWLSDNYNNKPSTIDNNSFSYAGEVKKYNLKTIVGGKDHVNISCLQVRVQQLTKGPV